MVRKLIGTPPGARKKEIDWGMVELALKAGTKSGKIASSMQITPSTLADRAYLHYGVPWPEYRDSLRNKGEMLLEAKQFECAMKGNVKMLIYLGKVRLKQVEAVLEQSNRGKDVDITNEHKLMMLQHQLSSIKDMLIKKGIDLDKEIELREALKKGETITTAETETIVVLEPDITNDSNNGDTSDNNDDDDDDE